MVIIGRIDKITAAFKDTDRCSIVSTTKEISEDFKDLLLGFALYKSGKVNDYLQPFEIIQHSTRRATEIFQGVFEDERHLRLYWRLTALATPEDITNTQLCKDRNKAYEERVKRQQEQGFVIDETPLTSNEMGECQSDFLILEPAVPHKTVRTRHQCQDCGGFYVSGSKIQHCKTKYHREAISRTI